MTTRALPKRVKRSNVTGDPVSLAELKTWVNQESNDHDALLTSVLTSARQAVEDYLTRSLVSSTFNVYVDQWPSEGIVLPYPPVSSVTHVKYYDVNDTQQTLDPGKYTLINDTDDSSFLLLAENLSPPTLSSWRPNPIEVEYEVTNPPVPEQAKVGIMWVASMMYENQDPTKVTVPHITPPVEHLLSNLVTQ